MHTESYDGLCCTHKRNIYSQVTYDGLMKTVRKLLLCGNCYNLGKAIYGASIICYYRQTGKNIARDCTMQNLPWYSFGNSSFFRDVQID